MKTIYAIFIACLLFVSCTSDQTYKVIPFYSTKNPDSLLYFTYADKDNTYFCYIQDHKQIVFVAPIKTIICDSSTPYIKVINHSGWWEYIWYSKKGLPVPPGDIFDSNSHQTLPVNKPSKFVNQLIK